MASLCYCGFSNELILKETWNCCIRPTWKISSMVCDIHFLQFCANHRSACHEDMLLTCGAGTFIILANIPMFRFCFRFAKFKPLHLTSLAPCQELQCWGTRPPFSGDFGGGGLQGVAGGGASGRCSGASVRGISSSSSSKFPAQASRFVRKNDKLKRFLTVAGSEVNSNCEVLKGPCWGSWKTAPLPTQGEISIDVARKPNLLKSNGWPHFGCLPGMIQEDPSAGTPSCGGITWS